MIDNRNVPPIPTASIPILVVSLGIALFVASCGGVSHRRDRVGSPEDRRPVEEMTPQEEIPAREWESLWLPILERVGREPFTDWEGKSSLSRLVTSILTGDSSGETPLKAMNAIYNFVQKEVFPSDLPPFEDGSDTLHTPWETLERGTGTSLEIALLYRALLNEAWIKAFIVPVRSREMGSTVTSPTTLNQFDHVLVYVPPGFLDHELWLDPTTLSCPFGTLPPYLENVKGIMLDPKDIHLVVTPRSRADDNVTGRYTGITLDEDGAITFRIESTFGGNRKILENRSFHGRNDIDHNMIMMDRTRGESSDAVLQFYSISGIDMPDTALVMNYEFRVPGGDRQREDTLTLPLTHLPRLDPLGEVIDTGHPLDLWLVFPQVIEESIEIHLPEGFEAVTIPGHVDIDGEYLRWKVELHILDHEVRLNTCFRMEYPAIPAEGYDEFREAADCIRRFRETLLSFRRD